MTVAAHHGKPCTERKPQLTLAHIAPLHLLLVTAEPRGELREEDLHSALDVVRILPEYLVFLNVAGSGATRPEHVHFQALLRDEDLPIQSAPRRTLFAVGGMVVARVEHYPIYSLTLRGERVAETTMALVRELSPVPFNLVLVQDEVIIAHER